MSQLLKNILQADDPWIHPDTCHPFRCFQRPCGSTLPGWSLICMNLWSPSGQREDILCLPRVCRTLLFSALFVVTWNNTECIILGVLQLMTPARLCPLSPSQRNRGKKGGDGKLALECSRDTSTPALNCGLPLRVSVPREQHRPQGKLENMAKDKNKCLSLDAPGIMLIKLYVYFYMHNALSKCFKTQCAFTTHLWHRAHLKLVFTANAKVCAGSVAAVQ